MVKLFLISLVVIAIIIAIVVVYLRRKKKNETAKTEPAGGIKVLSAELEKLNVEMDVVQGELDVSVKKNEVSCEIGEAANTLFDASEKRLQTVNNSWDAAIKDRGCLTQEKDNANFISAILIPAQVKAVKGENALTEARMAELEKKKKLVKKVTSLFFELKCSGIQKKEAAVYLGLPLVEETKEVQVKKSFSFKNFSLKKKPLVGALTAIFIVTCFMVGSFI